MNLPRFSALLFLAFCVLFSLLRFNQTASLDQISEIDPSPKAAPEPSRQNGALSEKAPPLTRPETTIEHVANSIARGIPIRLSSGDAKSPPIYFRPTTVTAAEFRATIGTGSDELEVVSQQVFTGRSVLGAERASLAIVNGQLAAHVRNADNSIRHFRSNPLTGELESILEQVVENICEIDPATNIALTLTTDPLPEDPWEAAAAASIEPDPEIAASSGYNPANGNLQFTDRPIPYGRAYDSSLKDILVLAVLDKGATGNDTASNLSAKTATYLSLMANISAMYKHNLGLRIIVQELILTPNTDAFTDVANGTGSLADFRNWVGSQRARGTYRWTVAAKFGAVNGDGVLGIAYVGAANGSNGVSVNRTGNLNVPTHEIGHNMGSSHTSGGVMNPSVNNSRNFFNNLESQERTGAWAIYNYMSNGGANTQGRAFPSNRKLRHAEQIPFASDDNLSTLPNQPVRFRPMDNDDTSVLNGAENELSLVEASAIFPPGAGEAWVYDDEIEFRPAPGFDGTAWLSYTIRGSVGNSGAGWLHKGDVAIRIDGSGTNPPNLSSSTANPDFVHHSSTGALVLNPIVDDHGPGHLNVNHTTPTLGTSNSSTALTNGFYLSDATLLDPAKGTLAFNRVDITLTGGSRVDLIRHLTFTPASGATGPVRIQYTLNDASGAQITQTATVLLGVEETLIGAPATARYRVPTDASEALTWASPDFDDSGWTSGDSGFGYEASTSGTPYTSLIDSDTRSEMFNGSTCLYVRFPFEVNDHDDFQSLRLEMQYDDGFTAMLNGVTAESRNTPDPLLWNSISTSNHEASITSFDSFSISTSIGNLEPGTNILAIHGLNASNDSSDFVIRPRLVATKKFTLGGIAHPKQISIPSGVGLVLDGFLRGITEAPFANSADVRWSTLTPGVVFSDPTQTDTTATFPKPGIHTLRMRITEAGYVEEHEIEVFVGSPSDLDSGPLASAGADLIIPADGTHQLISYTENAETTTWTQTDGPSATIGSDGSIQFSSTGAHTFRLSASGNGITTFDEVTIIRGSGIIDVAPAGSIAQHAVPISADDLIDAVGNEWFSSTFDDANWQAEPALYGFEYAAGYQDLYQVDLQIAMHEISPSLLVRLPFFSPTAGNLDLSMRYEDGFAAYLNGSPTAISNNPVLPLTWDSQANANQPDAAAIVPESFNAGAATAGSNLLAIHALNSSITSSDFLLIPELSVSVSAGSPFQARLISNDSAARFLVPTAPVPSWFTSTFNDSAWQQTAAALGYERSGSGNFDEHFFTDVEELVYDQNETLYLRIPFIVPDGFSINTLSLRAKYDDGFVAFLNEAEVARDRFTGTAVWNSGISGARDEDQTTTHQSFDLTGSIPSLQPGLNLLAIQVMNAGITSSDFLFAPQLIAEFEPNAGSPYERWFAAAPGTAGRDSSPDADLDNDGLNNLLEFAFGGDPLSAQTNGLRPTINGSQFSFFRRIDHLSAGLSYVIESSTDLDSGTWSNFTPTRINVQPSGSSGIETVVARIPIDDERKFYRLRVTLAE